MIYYAKLSGWIVVAGLLLGGATMLTAAYWKPAKSTSKGHELLLELEAEALLNDPQYAMQFIRTSQPNPNYNCHGWSFADGRRSVTVDEVYKYISGFRYRPVILPEPGDIVVYYDANNELCHSGIVKATGTKGFVLVESKWGALGRFLHLLETPQVATRYAFYRRREMPPPSSRWSGPVYRQPNPGYSRSGPMVSD